MFNTFEQAHDEFLEPRWVEVVARDWKGQEIYKGEGDYYQAPDGEFVHESELNDWLYENFTEKQF